LNEAIGTYVDKGAFGDEKPDLRVAVKLAEKWAVSVSEQLTERE
jgi:hypothetical protein